jgi:hypothetical protein
MAVVTAAVSAGAAVQRLHELVADFRQVGIEYDLAAEHLVAVLRRQRALHAEFHDAAVIVRSAGRAAEIPAVCWGKHGSHQPLWLEVGVIPSRTVSFPLWPPQR